VVWGNLDFWNQGYDVVLLGSNEPIKIDLDAVARRVTPDIEKSITQVGFRSTADLFGSYAARSADLRIWLAGSQINRNLSLRLQYLAGMSVNQGSAALIYGEIEKRGGFPKDLFSGTPDQLAAVRKSFDDWRSDY
jgi:hypothetical protein